MNVIQFSFVNRSMRDALRDAEPHHHVHFNMQSNEFTHAFQSSNFDVEEVRGFGTFQRISGIPGQEAWIW